METNSIISPLVCNSTRFLMPKKVGVVQWEAFQKIGVVEKSMLLQADLKWNTDFILINKSR
jgi:hypothetical protein